MRIQVQDFMGCERAELDVSRLALVVGLNHQGKSSICRAAGAALSGETVPLGLRKSDTGMLVRSGAAKAVVTIESDAGKAIVNWPKAERHTEGKPPFASPFAIGTASLVDMTAKDVVDTLTKLMKAAPTRDDLAESLLEAKVNENTIEEIWKSIDRDGWDLAHQRAVDKGRELKAQWDYATGEKYGSKKGDAWVPAGWDESLAGSSHDSLEARVTTARAELEDAIARDAVDDDTRARLESDAAELDAAKSAVAKCESARTAAQEVLDAAKSARAALPPADNDAGMPCPHCGGMVIVENVWKSGQALKAAETVDDATLKQRRLARAEADGDVGNAESQVGKAQRELGDAQAAVGRAQRAADRLSELAAKPAASSAVDVDSKREAVRRAEADLKAFSAKVEADRLHRNVVANQFIVDVLAQTGVRKTVLLRMLKKFNSRLHGLCQDCGWAAVDVTPDMTTELGGRPYVLLSASEQYRVRVTIQMAISELDASDVLIFDAAEVLDGKGRAGLLKCLHKRKRRAVIGMMMAGVDKAPDLSAMGAGVVYWVQSGICAESSTTGDK